MLCFDVHVFAIFIFTGCFYSGIPCPIMLYLAVVEINIFNHFHNIYVCIGLLPSPLGTDLTASGRLRASVLVVIVSFRLQRCLV